MGRAKRVCGAQNLKWCLRDWGCVGKQAPSLAPDLLLLSLLPPLPSALTADCHQPCSLKTGGPKFPQTCLYQVCMVCSHSELVGSFLVGLPRCDGIMGEMIHPKK